MAAWEYGPIWLFFVYPVSVLTASLLAPPMCSIERRPLLAGFGVALYAYVIAISGELVIAALPVAVSQIAVWAVIALYIVLIAVPITALLIVMSKREYRDDSRIYVAVWWVIAIISGLLAMIVLPNY